MTGRELIIYILENKLEDEQIFENGKLIGFLSIEEAAVEYNVGVETIKLWVERNVITGIKIDDKIYISSKYIRKPNRGDKEVYNE